MASTGEVGIQAALHSIEQGKLAPIIRGLMFAVLIIALTLLYLFVQFRGFNSPTAMDQAQIARNIAAGEGFTTDYIRPLAVWQLQNAGKEFTLDSFPDFLQSPLAPYVHSIPLGFVKDSWKMTATDLVYAGDRIIAGTGILFFLLSVAVWFFVATRLFDVKLALTGSAIVLLTDMMWQFSLSGLPQMLLLFLFSGAIALTVLAMQLRERIAPMLACLFGSGLLFGLMILGHALAVWMFVGWLIFALVFFPPRGLAALVGLAAALVIVLPWLVRTQAVSGTPFGLAIYAAVAPGTPEQGYLRSLEGTPPLSGAILASKVKTNASEQVERIFSFLGMNLAAGAFFLALLHPFRSKVTSSLRWAIVLMWVFAVIGMALFGVEGPVSANQLHVLFIPLFVFYGIAFLLVLWSRLEIGYPLLRILFVTAVMFLCAVPLLATLFAGKGAAIQWPPYVPPFIAVLGDWFTEDEVIASDMPWAVAWYAQRSSLLLPESVKAFNDINDYRRLGAPINGLYMTPVTGNLRLFSEIYKGPYRDWALLITRPPRVEGFALPFFTPLPIDGECIIFSDRDRWSRRN